MHSWGILVPIIAVSIPIFAIMARVVNRWLQVKERQIEAMGRDAAEKGAQYAAHTDRLEQRVRVLERIVTDKGITVADEIEKLRDQPLN
jgi:hypothetical protein